MTEDRAEYLAGTKPSVRAVDKLRLLDLPLDAVLCYVDGGLAYFTTQSLDKQWGDDWDDSPWEHNAGPPYAPCWHREGGKPCDCRACRDDWNEDGTPKWQVVTIAFDGNFTLPNEEYANSPYCVRDINAGRVAWLRPSPFGTDHGVSIFAGTPPLEFVRLVRDAGGTVFWPVEMA